MADPINTYSRLTGKRPSLDPDIAAHVLNAAPSQGESRAVAAAIRAQAARNRGAKVEVSSGRISIDRPEPRPRPTSSKKKGCGLLLFVLSTVAVSATLLTARVLFVLVA